MRRLPSLVLTAGVTALIFGTTIWVQEASYGPSEEIPTAVMAILAAQPEVATALAAVADEKERILDDWITMASTPASSRSEGRRAEIVERRLRAGGLVDVRRDASGNVIGVLPGRDRSAKKVVFMAHMDTVARMDADFTVRRENGILKGPGVRDDSSGLSAMLIAARIAKASGISPPTDVLLVASVEEEIGLNARTWP